MQATTTKLINRIWGEYYSNHLLEESNEGTAIERKDDDEGEEQEHNEDRVKIISRSIVEHVIKRVPNTLDHFTKE